MTRAIGVDYARNAQRQKLRMLKTHATGFHRELRPRVHCDVGAVGDLQGHARHRILNGALRALKYGVAVTVEGRIGNRDRSVGTRLSYWLTRRRGSAGLRDVTLWLNLNSVPGVFAGGDCNSGHSLLIGAIGEGRDLACAIDQHLTGSSRLRTRHAPLQPGGWDLAG